MDKNFLKENFGFDEVVLTDQEDNQLKQYLKKAEEKRLEFFALITFIFIAIMLVLDGFLFDASLRKFYFIADLIILLSSASCLFFSSKERRKGTILIIRLKEVCFTVYPFLLLLWATAICALDTTSMLNLLTFYSVLCVISFAVIIPFKRLLFAFFLIISEYILLTLSQGAPLWKEPFITVLVGCFLILPFYSSFRRVRENSIAALIKLKTINEELKQDVETSIKKLQHLNHNLNDEVGQRKIIESKLRESLRALESNNQLKSEFLANISHEIRTPLNSIIGFTEMMTDEGIPPERKREFQELIASNTMSLLSTLDDIFDLSLLKSGQLTVSSQSCKVNNILESLYYDLNGVVIKYNQKHLNLIKTNIENADLVVKTDDFYLRKALIRLIDNAFKFTEEGSIEIGAAIETNGVVFYVSDTGIGIPGKDQIRIFEPFVQGDGSFKREHSGAGLGLSVVKGITRALGAEFDFQSRPGAGSKFMIRYKNSFLQ
ncbi:MAG TPA: HAMP domain-containing sensor histidine kinase [Prolixibacteraceae bacterium]|nr:HAMP domain-containing sensor histidine kinase [Prolixibacteraceae bacterium]